MDENSGWRKTIAMQAREIPILEEMLAVTVNDTTLQVSRKQSNEVHFSRQMESQFREMTQLNFAIDQQQKRLARDCENEAEGRYDIDALCTQDILRERIKMTEKGFIELKCNFMNYLSTLL